MYILFFFVVFIGLGIIISNKKNKVFDVLLAISVMLLMCAPRVGYDVGNFEAMYNNVLHYGIDYFSDPYYNSTKPFLYIISFFQLFGIKSYYVFKMISLSILGVMVYKTFGKLCWNKGAVLFFYVIASFTSDAIQHRNTIALFLMLIAVYFLLSGHKRGDLLFCIFTGLASLIHITYVVYFVFLIAKYCKKNIKKLIRISLLVSMACVGIIFLFRGSLDIIANVVSNIVGEKYAVYFETRTNMGCLMPILIFTLFTIMLFFCNKRISRYQQIQSDRVDFLKKMTEIVLLANIMLYPTIAFTFFSLSTERILRNLMLVNIAVLVNNYAYFTKSRNERLIKEIMLTGVCVFYLVYSNFITGPASDIIYAIFDGKLFFVQ